MNTKYATTDVGDSKSYTYNPIHSSIKRVFDAIQEMEELGGPEFGDYVIALTLIKMDLDGRIKAASQNALLQANKTLERCGI